MGDFYKRLGVERGASHDEIRKAYKELSKEHHPDRAGGNEEKFKKIQEAHEVLSDEGRRKMYDMTGSDVGQGDMGPMGGMAAGGIPFSFMGGMGPFGMPGVSFDMGDMFQQMFGGGGGPGRRPHRGGKGPNKHHSIGLRLSEFYKGHEIKLKFNQARKCEDCRGTGGDTEACRPCQGSGHRTTMRQIGPGMVAQTRSPCDECRGEGRRIARACKGCSGKKFMEREKQLDIRITPGMKEGQQLTFDGECSDTAEYDAPGDVVLKLERTDLGVGDTDEYEWKGDDLWMRKNITFSESILGFSVTLADHPGGSQTFSWRGGPLLHGAVLRYEGGGMPCETKETKKGFGSLFLQVLVVPPPTTPWSAEDAVKLQSVLGGAVATLSESQILQLFTADPKLSIDRT